jgi:hypothetical protein
MSYKPLTRPGCCIPDFILKEIAEQAEQARKKRVSERMNLHGIMSAVGFVVAVYIACLAWQKYFHI